MPCDAVWRSSWRKLSRAGLTQAERVATEAGARVQAAALAGLEAALETGAVKVVKDEVTGELRLEGWTEARKEVEAKGRRPEFVVRTLDLTPIEAARMQFLELEADAPGQVPAVDAARFAAVAGE